MSIAPLSGIASSSFANRLAPLSAGSTGNAGGGFGELVSNALETVNSQQGNADHLAQQAATGQLQDPHEYMIAATEASLSTELTVAVRNKAVEAFNDIMRMSL